MPGQRPYDVIIIGSGLAGGVLATILARKDLSVLMLEAGSHPRFALGESVVPEFGSRARLLAELFDVPELAHMSNFQRLRHHISSGSGIKRNFSFLWHGEGQQHSGPDACQFQTMTYPFGPDSHIYRAELDHWLTALAVRYGATYRERAAVTDVRVDDDGVDVDAGGQTFRARFVVDGSGFRSVLARKEKLRQEDVGLDTDSRTIFSHLVGVRPIRTCRERAGRLALPSPTDQGTLHHLFDGGWLWVIPFDNHSLHVNPCCSVGLTLDRRKFPDNDRPAEEEFWDIVGRLPTVAEQLKDARPVRSWIKTGRLQYRSKRLAGDRWCLMPHAAGFVDALYSGGMTLTLMGVQDVAQTLLRVFREDRFAADQFAEMETGMGENLKAIDQLVHGAFLSFRRFGLFNAWFRFWAVSNYHASAGLIALDTRYQRSKNRAWLDKVFEPPYRRILAQEHPRLRAMVEDGYAILRRMDAEEIDAAAAEEGLYELLRRQEWIPPQFKIGDPRHKTLSSFTAFPLMRIVWWGKRHAPDDMRDVYYGTSPIYFWELTKVFGRELWRGVATFFRVVRDAHYSRSRF